jgi:pimeloyl-ACP methyl ester carboxylesterase
LKRDNNEDETFYNTSQLMMREGWGSTNPIYRNFFTSSFLPDASQEVKDSFDELQRMSCNSENAMRIWEMNNYTEFAEIAPQIKVPTLVLHMKGDCVVPVREGRLTARLIPGAQFVELPGNNHVALEGYPGFDMFFDEVRSFMAEHK